MSAETNPAACLVLRVATGDIPLSDISDEDWRTDDFQREIEKKVAKCVADLLYVLPREVDVEMEWFTNEEPCPHRGYGVNGDEVCGEQTAYRRNRWLHRGPSLFCIAEHDTPISYVERRAAKVEVEA